MVDLRAGRSEAARSSGKNTSAQGQSPMRITMRSNAHLQELAEISSKSACPTRPCRQFLKIARDKILLPFSRFIVNLKIG
jgi:hypothetical protein